MNYETYYKYEVLPVHGTNTYKVVRYKMQRKKGSQQEGLALSCHTVPSMKRVDKDVAEYYVFLKERNK